MGKREAVKRMRCRREGGVGEFGMGTKNMGLCEEIYLRVMRILLMLDGRKDGQVGMYMIIHILLLIFGIHLLLFPLS